MFALLALALLAPPAKPNVVLVLADDLGWADLGCTGSKYHKTPHLDRLAAAGVRFTDAYAACPVCSPTRASIVTGKYPARLHLTDWLPGRADKPDQRLARPAINTALPAGPTLAGLLKAAGYTTGHVGKWHLGGGGPTRYGFDVGVAEERGKTPAGVYFTDHLTDEAVKFVRGNKDRPFFLQVSHHAPHIPLEAKPEILAKYPNKPAPGRQSNPVYAATLESLDEGVGRLLQTLDELKLTDKTVVIFTSDNGGLATLEGPLTPATSNAPLREGKGYLYEGGLRVPLLVSAPGVTKSGHVSKVVACSTDFFPTVCELCGVAAPATDGMSLTPALRGEDGPKRDALYWHYPHYSNQGGKPGGAIREGDWKLIEFAETGRRELFNLKADIGESRNLALEKPEVVDRLSKKLAVWRVEAGVQTMTPNTGYVPHPQAADGSITLPARGADVSGAQLRYEPLPHKNCLGYWTRVEDAAEWAFTVTKPGAFTVEVSQGCGTGQGGSEAVVAVGGKELPFTVKDTGGFQAFEPRPVGTVSLEKAGRFTLTVRAKTKAKAAVMDVREIVLKPTP